MTRLHVHDIMFQAISSLNLAIASDAALQRRSVKASAASSSSSSASTGRSTAAAAAVAAVDYRFIMNRGDCYRALQRLDLALADYHYALDLQPNVSHTYTVVSCTVHA
jgi:tetratricopeptide (TPR) repeat protein